MPLVKKYARNAQMQIIVWSMDEEFLEYEWLDEIRDISHSARRKEKKTLRYVLDHYFKPFELSYDQQGKPSLTNSDDFISISHSKDMLVVAVSDRDFGVDVEIISPKALNVSSKFIHVNDFNLSNDILEEYHKTIIWSAKEAIFKKYSQKEHLIFKQQIAIVSIDENNGRLKARIEFQDDNKVFEELQYYTIEDHILVHTL